MKKIILFILYLIQYGAIVHGQESKKFFEKYPFVNQTEFTVLFGRTRDTYYYPSIYSNFTIPNSDYYTLRNTINLSLQTFNGVVIKPNTTVGITTGLDAYNSTLIMPIAAGIRQVVAQKSKNGAKIQIGLDTGWGFDWLNPKNNFEKLYGGIMINPGFGMKFPTKNGSSWLVNFGYKYQYLKIDQTEVNEYLLSSRETRNLKRLQVRVGFEW